MKKFFILFSVMILSANFALASKYPVYDAEVRKIRTVKNAQMAGIEQQISNLEEKIEMTEKSSSLTAAQKNQRIKNYSSQLEKLITRKNQIKQKYKNDKELLKKKYKN
ncbi:MAG: hypothetical protein K6C94_03230 [Candidatus Gastranaerophilales bacterium]|nr:hypothetical protein [Candidatus Gastranaerophilales bacterium]